MYEKITLPNGVRVLYENIPHVRSASVGVWIGSGSRHEKASQNGASHFIEHMVFKGTHTRTAAEIAGLMDGIGGQINAFTTKECTCFYVRALDTHLDTALDVLCDMFFNSKFDDSDIKNERGVILEEIDMYEDSPEDLVTERLFEAVYKGSPLALPILGKPSTLSKFKGKSLRDYMNKNYRPSDIVISMSGSFDRRHVEFISESFSGLSAQDVRDTRAAEYSPVITTRKKPIEQNHLCIAFPGLSYKSPRRYTLQLLSGILGGGMSSRLFQKVREESGLCYSIYTFTAGHEETGAFCIYTALSSKTEDAALELIRTELKKLLAEGPEPEEVHRAREQVKSNILMSLESTTSRMNNLGKSELFLNKVPTPDEIIASYDAATLDSIRELASEVIDFSRISLSAVGKANTASHYEEVMKA